MTPTPRKNPENTPGPADPQAGANAPPDPHGRCPASRPPSRRCAVHRRRRDLGVLSSHGNSGRATSGRPDRLSPTA